MSGGAVLSGSTYQKLDFLRYYRQIIGWHFDPVHGRQTCGSELVEYYRVILVSHVRISLTQAFMKRSIPSAGQYAAAHKRPIKDYNPAWCQRFGTLAYQHLRRSIADQVQQGLPAK